MIEDQVIYKIPLGEIHTDLSWNSREEEGIEYAELTRAIKADGQMQPGGLVLASAKEQEATGKKYILIYGFRRFVVVKNLKIPYYKAVIEEAATQEDRLKLNWAENHGRQELTFWEQTKFLAHRVEEGWTEEKIMKELRLSRSYVQPRVMLAKLTKKHPELIDLARANKLTQKNVRELNSFSDFEQCEREIKDLKEAAELGIKLKVKKNKAKTKRDLNTMLMERTKPMRVALVQWCHGQNIPIKPWYRIISWINGVIDTNTLLDTFDEMIHDPRNSDELKEIFDDLETYKDDHGRLYIRMARIKEEYENNSYERPINGLPDK